jgi:hypothetical protein
MRKVRSCRRGAGTGGLSWAILPVSPEYRAPGLKCSGIECFGIDIFFIQHSHRIGGVGPNSETNLLDAVPP